MCEKHYIWNPSTCTCENGNKHLENVFGNSVVICGKIIEVTKAVPTKIISRKTIPTEIILTNLNE